MITRAEFLTSQQVASFFSRLAAKRRLPDVMSGCDEEADDAERESVLQDHSGDNCRCLASSRCSLVEDGPLSAVLPRLT